jgi:hypothetical protein
MVWASMCGSFLFEGYGSGSSLNGPLGVRADARTSKVNALPAATPAIIERRLIKRICYLLWRYSALRSVELSFLRLLITVRNSPLPGCA